MTNDLYPVDFGSPGTVKRVDGRLICVPDKPRRKADAVETHAQFMDQLYRERDRELSKMWRTGK